MREPFRNLSPRDLNEIISDLSLLQEGARIFYVADPFEIVDFSFPLGPSAAKSHTVQIERVAEDQMALYSVFYRQRDKPVVFREYWEEIEGIAAYLESEIERVFSKAEIIDSLVKHASLEQIQPSGLHIEELVEQVEEHLTVVLAVSLGIFSIGIERFRDISKVRLQRSKLTRVPPLIRSVTTSFKRRQLTWRIFDALEDISKARAEYPHIAEFERERMRRANLRDATAVDKLLYLNSELEQHYNNADLDRRYIFLYLSSARKSRQIFGLKEVRDELVEIDHIKRYPVLRTRDQLFALTAFRKIGKDRRETYKLTKKRLLSLRGVVEERKKLDGVFSGRGTACEDCILHGGIMSGCRWEQYCEKVKDLSDIVQIGNDKYDNLALLGSLHDYRNRLFQIDAKKVSHREYVDFLKRVLQESKIRDLALERMRLLYQVMITKMEFATEIPTAVTKAGNQFLRLGRGEVVTVIEQYLPLRPNLTEELHKRIWSNLTLFLTDPAGGIEPLEKAFNLFLGEEAVALESKPEQELMRALFYLVGPKKDWDVRALDFAKQKMTEFPKLDREFRYVAIWAARRVRRFWEANKLAQQGIKSYPDDPRFYHGRALNTVAWLADPKQRKYCKHTFLQASNDSEAAVEFYMKDEEGNTKLINACLNNLAFCLANHHRAKNSNIRKSRSALETLVSRFGRDDWSPGYPEYFHTEAFLILEEVKLKKKRRTDSLQLVSMLEDARGKIRIARRLLLKEEHVQLEKEILGAIDEEHRNAR